MSSPNLPAGYADVSIIAANYNNGRFLSEFIESIARNTVLPRELILVDDGSTDDSIKRLESYTHLPWLKVIRLDRNYGLTYALNHALDLAEGTYVMRADPDDIFLPHRIEAQVSFLDTHPGTDIVGSNVTYFREPGVVLINQSNFPESHSAIAKRIQMGEHGIQHPTVMVRARLFAGFRYQPLFPGEDYELFARMLKNGATFANIRESLYLMRIHTGSSTSNLKFEHIQRTFRFRDHIFGTHTSSRRIWMYFQHIRFYRKYQLTTLVGVRHLFLLVAMILYPAKIWERIRPVAFLKWLKSSKNLI